MMLSGGEGICAFHVLLQGCILDIEGNLLSKANKHYKNLDWFIFLGMQLSSR